MRPAETSYAPAKSVYARAEPETSYAPAKSVYARAEPEEATRTNKVHHEN